MATIPRTYLTTSKSGLSDVPKKNGQVISVWDNDEVWYDAPADGTRDGQPIRRKISGIRVVSELPETPMSDIVYVYIGNHGYIPDPPDPEHPQLLYDLRVWENDAWLVVGNNLDDTTVRTDISNGKFYLVGAPDIETQIVSALRKNSDVYVENGVIFADLTGTASYATNAGHAVNADLATKATTDNGVDPKNLDNYLYNVSSDATVQLGSTLTFTLGNNQTKQVRVQDTTYAVFSQTTAGLVAGTNTQVASDNTNLILSGSGWLPIADITMPVATQASQDAMGQVIDDTYIKGASYDTTTDELTLVKGDGTFMSPISIPNTEYGVFGATTAGLVPAPTASNVGNFLKGDGTWQEVIQPTDVYQGATSSADGEVGLVPAAQAGEEGYYLKGDGTWGNTFGTDTDGLVPGPTSSDATKYLMGDGTWTVPTDTQNTAGSSNNTTDQLYLVGSTVQSSSSADGTPTYTNANIYVSNNKLYSNNIEVVTTTGSQALSGKTYEGYTLGNACEATLAGTVVAGSNVPTNDAIINYVASAASTEISNALEGAIFSPVIAPTYDNTETYAVDDFCLSDYSGSVLLYRCITAVATAEDFDPTKWQECTVIEAIQYLISQI